MASVSALCLGSCFDHLGYSHVRDVNTKRSHRILIVIQNFDFVPKIKTGLSTSFLVKRQVEWLAGIYPMRKRFVSE